VKVRIRDEKIAGVGLAGLLRVADPRSGATGIVCRFRRRAQMRRKLNNEGAKTPRIRANPTNRPMIGNNDRQHATQSQAGAGMLRHLVWYFEDEDDVRTRANPTKMGNCMENSPKMMIEA
jgi:hypothetical protein